MEKYKYEIYDYSKIGIKKERVLFRRMVSLFEYECLKDFYESKSEMVDDIFKKLKSNFEANRPKIYDYSPNFIFDYEIIIKNEIYTFHETSGKKE